MDGQAVIAAGRAATLRELKDEVARLREENSRLRAQSGSLAAHFAEALLAARDMSALAPGGTFYVVDGWNLVLGDSRRSGGGPLGTPPSPLGERLASWLERRNSADGAWQSHSPSSLLAEIAAFLDANPRDFAWVVFDGPRGNSRLDGRLRVSYTGGEGSQRADRLILDYIRHARLAASAASLALVSRDKDLLAAAKKLLHNR